MAIRETSWMCVFCGYAMDATTGLENPDDVPTEDDFSMCLNCGHVYVRHGVRWVPITMAEREAMPEETRATIARAQAVRPTVINTDLAKGRGGRA